jgi:hypothetical protein
LGFHIVPDFSKSRFSAFSDRTSQPDSQDLSARLLSTIADFRKFSAGLCNRVAVIGNPIAVIGCAYDKE